MWRKISIKDYRLALDTVLVVAVLVGLRELLFYIGIEGIALTSLTAIDAPPAVPADGESVQVLARVDAVTSQFAPTQLVYPLTLQGVGGRWVIAALDQAPAMSVDDDLVPVVVSPGAAK